MKTLTVIMSLLLVVSFGYGQKKKGFKKTESGLQYKITELGKGPKPEPGDKVQVHYVGTLDDGTEFDSSRKRNQAFTFELGAGQVIKGWDEGLALLTEGSKATLIIPPDIGYGSQDKGKIPPNSTLTFEIEVLRVIPGIKIPRYEYEDKPSYSTETGVIYYKVEEGPEDADQADYRTYATVHYSAYLADGKMFDSSVKKGNPVTWELGKGPLKGFDEGITKMKVGDKFTLEIPPSMAFGDKEMRNVPANSTIFIDVELVKVYVPVKVEPYKVEGLDTVKTKSGLQYIVVKSTDEPKAKFGKQVKVHYTGYFEDGKIFDSSVKRGNPIEFALGVGKVIKGWDEGIALMKKGEKFRLIIPYYLAYGEKGGRGIPPKANLIFDVELIDVGY